MDQKAEGYTRWDYLRLAWAFEVIAQVFTDRGDSHKAAYYAAEAKYNRQQAEKVNKEIV